ncbi:MAG: hypothetical protein WCH43_13100 [Verrucomicrobiota bacterium]
MDTIFQGTNNRPKDSLIERLENTARLLRAEKRPFAQSISIDGLAMIMVWFLGLTFGVVVWYWLISTTSATLA